MMTLREVSISAAFSEDSGERPDRSLGEPSIRCICMLLKSVSG